jgi:hypothetical protein
MAYKAHLSTPKDRDNDKGLPLSPPPFERRPQILMAKSASSEAMQDRRFEVIRHNERVKIKLRFERK